MFRFDKRSKLLIVTMFVAIFALRVAGLHAHLCMDGSEPPLTIHVADAGLHHADSAGESEPHADRDVPLASDVVAKKPYGDADLSLLAAFCAALLFFLARRRELRVFPALPAFFPSAPVRLRPPLRGPPA